MGRAAAERSAMDGEISDMKGLVRDALEAADPEKQAGLERRLAQLEREVETTLVQHEELIRESAERVERMEDDLTSWRFAEDSDRFLHDTLTGFGGVDIELWRRVVLLGEYHFGFNDDDDAAQSHGRGYLNAGVRVVITDRVTVEFDLRDVLENHTLVSRPGREVRVILTR